MQNEHPVYNIAPYSITYINNVTCITYSDNTGLADPETGEGRVRNLASAINPIDNSFPSETKITVS